VTDIKQKVRIARETSFPVHGRTRVPQIWLTYDELATLMNCDPARAREAAIVSRLDRRKSRDGQTRAKLTPPLAEAFLREVLRQRLDQEIAACAGDLRVMRDRMAEGAAAVLPHRRVIAG
jgi:hypothetical protein